MSHDWDRQIEQIFTGAQKEDNFIISIGIITYLRNDLIKGQFICRHIYNCIIYTFSSITSKAYFFNAFPGLTNFDVMQGIDTTELTSENMAAILMPQQSVSPKLPPGCPAWAARLKKCEVRNID